MQASRPGSLHIAQRIPDASLTTREHQYHSADEGFMSEFHFGLARMRKPIAEAKETPEATAALVKEWSKLRRFSAWDFSRSNQRKW